MTGSRYQCDRFLTDVRNHIGVIMTSTKKNTDNLYKGFGDLFGDLDQETVNKLRDPVVLGVLISRLIEERENTNRLLKTLISRIEELERRLGEKETPAHEDEILLSEKDEELYTFVKAMGKVCAEDVAREFGYKGRNAASARLNKLVNMGLLKKKQAGKKVYFLLR